MPQTILIKPARVLLIVFLCVSACENQPPQNKVGSITIEPTPTKIMRNVALVAPQIISTPKITRNVAPVAPQVTSTPITESLPKPAMPIRPTKLVRLPKILVGLTSKEFLAIFGSPLFVRKEPPAEYWRYQSQSCVLEVFLYSKNGDLRVDYVNTGSNGGTQTKQSRCIENFRQQG